jgi:nucleoside-diphosphate-sugar epimerase
MRILLTGATGCTGSYLLKQLAINHDVYALARRPQQLPSFEKRLDYQVIEGDLETLIVHHQNLLKTFDYCVHPVTAWGGPQTFQVNVQQTLALFASLSTTRCRGIHYFSTASLLNAKHQFQRESLRQGTDYIRSKACVHERLSQGTLIPVHSYYPTVILGGDNVHPYTPVSQFLPQLHPYLHWVKWLHIQAYFHWIHAEDIAQIIAYRIAQDLPAKSLVLGNPAISVTGLQQELLDFYRMRHPRLRLDLEKCLPLILPLLSGQMSSWDRFSLHHRDIRYDSVHARTYGLVPFAEHITQLL